MREVRGVLRLRPRAMGGVALWFVRVGRAGAQGGGGGYQCTLFGPAFLSTASIVANWLRRARAKAQAQPSDVAPMAARQFGTPTTDAEGRSR